MLSSCVRITRVLRTLWRQSQQEGRLGVITEGVDKPIFQTIWVAVYITTDGIYAACDGDA